jgi:heme/copper-type cytochrome/quinol oxidase subunit 2
MNTPTTYKELVDGILGLIGIAVPLIFGLVFVFLVWKIIDSWVINAGDEGKREEGRQYAIVATVVMVVMVATWGVVALLRKSVFGL